jgi:hypothetical protein
MPLNRQANKILTGRCHQIPDIEYIECTGRDSGATVRLGWVGMRTIKVHEPIPDKELGYTDEEIKARRLARKEEIAKATANNKPIPKLVRVRRWVAKEVSTLLKTPRVELTVEEIEADTFLPKLIKAVRVSKNEQAARIQRTHADERNAGVHKSPEEQT